MNKELIAVTIENFIMKNILLENVIFDKIKANIASSQAADGNFTKGVTRRLTIPETLVDFNAEINDVIENWTELRDQNVCLDYLYRKSVKDTAKVLGMTQAAVKKILKKKDIELIEVKK